MVILVDITSPSKANNVLQTPKIVVEEWINIPDPDVQHPSPRIYKEYNLTDPIPPTMQMEFPLWAFFDLPLPGQLPDDTNLILGHGVLDNIRHNIVGEWLQEVEQRSSQA